jgi:UDP-N-acetylglucosamine--N-acetylmuramyl-(pentapeptide) pyrophosphoryl-undecaprenol N-acetylglucosamine transferase
VPALAVADALRDRGAEVSFVGAVGRSEAELVPAAGFEIDLLRVEGIDRSSPLRSSRAVALALAAAPVARKALRRRGVDAVMGGGGYVAGPAGVAALSMRTPLVLTEADRHLGLANRLLASRARRVCLAFPIDGLEGDRYLVTGRPVPAAVGHADRGAARERFGIGADERCLLVFGGSQGARTINETALAAFAAADAPSRDFHVLHISGHRDYATARQRLDAAAEVAGGTVARYTLLRYEPNLADSLAACDLVLARAGGSVFELAAAGRPAILVPYPHAAARHQHANAAWMADAGAALVVEDADLSPARLTALASEVLGDPGRLERMSEASRALARPDAAERIADEILAAVGR